MDWFVFVRAYYIIYIEINSYIYIKWFSITCSNNLFLNTNNNDNNSSSNTIYYKSI